MLRDYLGQTCTLKSKIGSNVYNEAVYEEKEILCRLVDKYKVITNSKGDEVVSSGVIQCVEHIKAGDLINDRKVISVSYMTSLDGIIGYRGYLV
ncbi:hypothetical protein [Terrisporobacter vanillatitrophus]|uniref:hypothetical protein n=1 Tax=Terrisporobacter vanillatitrophus TaxID=3058402 RepID=UPI003369A6F9